MDKKIYKSWDDDELNKLRRYVDAKVSIKKAALDFDRSESRDYRQIGRVMQSRYIFTLHGYYMVNFVRYASKFVNSFAASINFSDCL